MTWLQQAIHVAKKDLRMSRWFLAVYVFAVVSAIPAAISQIHSWSIVAPIAVMLIGFTCAAFIVQVDSPYRADVFWASKPLHRTAVWAGKLLFIFIVLVGIAAVGKAIALLAAFKLAPATVGDVLTESVIAYGSFLAAAVFIASITPDLRVLFLVCMLYVLLPNVIGYLMVMARPEAQAMAAVAMGIRHAMTVTAVTLLLSALVYRTRSRKLAIGVALAYTVVMMFLPTGRTQGVFAEEPELPHLPADFVTPVFTVSRNTRELNDQPERFRVFAKLDSTARHYAYALHSLQAQIHFAGDSTTSVGNVGFPAIMNVPALPFFDDTTTVQYNVRSSPSVGYDLYLTSEQRKQVLSGNATIVVSGYVDVLAPEIALTMPAQEGASRAKDGVRLKIDQIRAADDWITLEASIAKVARAPHDRPDYMTPRLPEYGLVNRRYGRGVELQMNAGHTTGFGVVMLGGETAIGTLTLQNGMPGYQPGTDSIDAQFVDGAELVHFQWRRIGTIPVSAPLTVTSN